VSESGDILTIRQLAEYLMVSEKTVYRMLDRNRLPAARVGAQWRFRRQDIDAWLNEEMRRVEHEGKREVLETLQSSELAIQSLLTPENIWLSVAAKSRDELLSFLAHEATIDTHVDRDLLFRSIRDREQICSTAIVPHAAFPHPLDPLPFRFSGKRVLMAVLREPIDFLDPHGHRPRVIVAILARSVQGHLLALSRAIKLFGDDALIDRLGSALTADDAIRFVGDAEERITIPKERR
jgi:PTS system nitrogen regulatory IIA component